MKEGIAQKELKALLHYDPLSGNFVWITTPKYGRARKGAIAGCVNKSTGYHVIRVNHVRYHAHRLVFLYMLGRFSEYQVDHINHIRIDNRWSNLREVTSKDNDRNRSKSKINTSGFTGVCWNKQAQKWVANIRHEGDLLNLGYFSSPEEAYMVRQEKATELGFHANHGK